MSDLNPQAEQMVAESMVRCLDAQARAVWPQESALLGRYRLGPAPRVLDAGCGTGEGASRLAEFFPGASVLGVDVADVHLDVARARYAALRPRLTFANQSVYGLTERDATFDLTVCRHVIQAIPHPDRVLAELVRVTKRGGYLHIIAEDYGMLHFARGALDPRDFWHVAAAGLGAATGTDPFVGRHAYQLLSALRLDHIAVDYIVVDTLRVPRDTFAEIIEAWRDGYAAPIGKHTPISRSSAVAYFDQMIATIRDPQGYAVWMVPVVSARVP